MGLVKRRMAVFLSGDSGSMLYVHSYRTWAQHSGILMSQAVCTIRPRVRRKSTTMGPMPVVVMGQKMASSVPAIPWAEPRATRPSWLPLLLSGSAGKPDESSLSLCALCRGHARQRATARTYTSVVSLAVGNYCSFVPQPTHCAFRVSALNDYLATEE